MTRTLKYLGTIAFGLSLVAVGASATAQDAASPQREAGQRGSRAQNRALNRERSQAGNLDDKTTGANIRTSQLMGMHIQNSRGEGVGEVNDIVVNANTGRVRYLAVTYGGFLGVGNKMFAVPFEAFTIQRSADDADKYLLVLNVTPQQLEGAQGFDEDSWPNFADTSFTSELDKRYGVDRRRRNQDRDRNADVDVRINGDARDADIDADTKPNVDRS